MAIRAPTRFATPLAIRLSLFSGKRFWCIIHAMRILCRQAHWLGGVRHLLNAYEKIPHVYEISLLDSRYARYVGSTTGKTNRLYSHLWHLKRGSHHSAPLQAAWNKHGASQFRYRVVERTTVDCLRARERHWLVALAAPGSDLPKYNCSREVDQPPHWTPSPQTRAKWSAQRLGRKHTAESRAAIRRSSLGRRHTMNTLEKMRRAHAGRRPTIEALERSVEVARIRFARRMAEAKRWCRRVGIARCQGGETLRLQLALALETGRLTSGELLPSVGALARAVSLSHSTVSMMLRRRAPVVCSLTIAATGVGLVVQAAPMGLISRPSSYYALARGARLSLSHRERGIRPSVQCILARRRSFDRKAPKPRRLPRPGRQLAFDLSMFKNAE